MLHLWYSNRMEALVDTLLRVQSDDQQDPLTSLFTPLSLIIPNRQMDTFVRLSMARLTGITANVQSFFLGNFLTELLADTPGRLLTADVLHRLLLDVFHDQDILRHPALAPVRSYLAAAGSHAATADHRRFQFAGEVARLLEEYSFTRPAMLQEWEAQATADSGSTTMAWQRLLWRQLRAANGICERCTQRTGLAWLLLPEVGDWLLEQQVAIPAQLHIFGFSYVAESYHRLLARLAACSAVHLYMLHPCLEDDWSMAYRDPQEALRLWGRPGRENVRLLRQRTACTVTPQTLDPLAAGETVLRRVQHDILYRQAPAAGKAASRIPTDGSIRFLECPSLRREIDSIAETIWAMLQHDPGQGPERLRFSDIAVLVPAAQQDLYQAHIAAVFQEYHGIPYSMIDLPPVATSRVVDAVTRLLALPLGTFTRREVLQFVMHPVVCCRYPEVDTERWLQWCDAVGIVHGLDHQDHADTYIEDEVFHWDQGLRRLLLGTFLSGMRQDDLRAFPVGDAAYLPYDTPADQLESVALFLRVLRSLMADVRYCQTTHLPLRQWAQLLGHLVSAYIDAPEEADTRTLAQCLQRLEALAELEPAGWSGQPVSYQVASDFALAALGDMPGQRGTYLSYGVAVSSCVPMRPIPFRVVFVAGLSEGNFPAAERDNPLDVRLGARQPGDVSRGEQDRFMFLETLVSTRDCVILSYVCRDAPSGEPLPASPLWYDLRAMLMPQYLTPAALASCTMQVPARRHDPRYFPELFPAVPAPLATVLPAARTQARAMALHQHLQHWCAEHQQPFPDWQRLLTLTAPPQWAALQEWLGFVDLPTALGPEWPPEQPVAIAFEALQQFLCCPLQAWGRWVLRLQATEDDDVLLQEDEPLQTSPPDSAVLLREVFLEVARQQPVAPEPAVWEAMYNRQARWRELTGKMPVGVFRQAERQRHLALLQHWSHSVQTAWQRLPADLEVVRFGRAAEHERVDTLLPSLDLEVMLPGVPHPLQVELYGRTDLVSPTVPGSLRLLLRHHADIKDALRAFLDYVVLCALQYVDGHTYQGLAIPSERSQSATFAPLDPATARHYLATLVSDLLGQPHAYLFPIEAVQRYDPATKPFAEAVHDCIVAQHYSSRYGPLPHPDEYPVPAEDVVPLLIERRFGLFHTLCQMSRTSQRG